MKRRDRRYADDRQGCERSDPDERAGHALRIAQQKRHRVEAGSAKDDEELVAIQERHQDQCGERGVVQISPARLFAKAAPVPSTAASRYLRMSRFSVTMLARLARKR